VPQQDFDKLLHLTDCAVIRGEDSFVRAQLAGKPFFWHIYPQDEHVHLDKLHAFWDKAHGFYTPETASAHRRLSDDLADKADKSCYYACVLVLVRHENDPQPIIAEGIWHGQWQTEAAGTNGFGYDPHFYLPEHNCTAAELAPEIKNAESHRGQALRELLRKIEAL